MWYYKDRQNKKRRKDTHGNIHHEKAGVAISTSEKDDFRRTITTDKRKRVNSSRRHNSTNCIKWHNSLGKHLAISFKSKYVLTI